LEQGGSHFATRFGPALPAHHVVDPVVEDGDRVLQRSGRAPDPGRPSLLAGSNLVVEGDDLLFVQVFSFHGALQLYEYALKLPGSSPYSHESKSKLQPCR